MRDPALPLPCPPERPTREQVEGELARIADPLVCSDELHRLLAAEVRALHADMDRHQATLIEALELDPGMSWDDIAAYARKRIASHRMANATVARRTVQLAEAMEHPDATWPQALRLAIATRDQLTDAGNRRTLGGTTRPTTPDWDGQTHPHAAADTPLDGGAG